MPRKLIAKRNKYVYLLFDHRCYPRYVGVGQDKRCYSHLKIALNGSKSHKSEMIRNSMKEIDDYIVVFIREDIFINEAFEIEVALIKAIGRYPNGPLLNLTDGGAGIVNLDSRLSEERIFTARNSMKKYHGDREFIDRRNKAIKIGLNKPEAKEKLSKAGKKYWENPDPEFVENLFNRKDPETANRRNEGVRRAYAKQEVRDRHKAAIHKAITPELRAKRKIITKNRIDNMSPEERENWQRKIRESRRKFLDTHKYMWITNGIESKTIDVEREIPEFWYKGRTISKIKPIAQPLGE